MLTRNKPPTRDREAERAERLRRTMAAGLEVAQRVQQGQRGVIRRADLAPVYVPPVIVRPKRTGSAVDGKHAATERERDYMGRVAALGCVICRLLGNGPTPAQVHHIRTGQGGAQRAGNYLTLPLCEPHHTGPTGIHGDKSCLRLLKVTEIDLLDLTIAQVMVDVLPGQPARP